MAIQLVLKEHNADPGGRSIVRTFQVQCTGNYAPGGDTANFAAATNPINAPRGKIPVYGPPAGYRFDVTQCPAGYTAEVIVNPVNPTIQNYLFKIFDIHAGLELAAGAYPAGITGDVNGFIITCTTPKKYG